MVCLYCGHETNVVNSRLKRRDNHTWRRRQCSACKSVFTTHEQPELASAIAVTAPGNCIEPFTRDKLFLSIYKSCEHRASGLEDATGLTQIIITNLLQRPAAAVLETAAIAEAAYTALQRFDKTAATVYNAYYRQ